MQAGSWTFENNINGVEMTCSLLLLDPISLVLLLMEVEHYNIYFATRLGSDADLQGFGVWG